MAPDFTIRSSSCSPFFRSPYKFSWMMSFTSINSFSIFRSLSASVGSYHFLRKTSRLSYLRVPPSLGFSQTDGLSAKVSLKSINKLFSKIKAALSGYSLSVTAVAERPSLVVQQQQIPTFYSNDTAALLPGGILSAIV